MVLKKQFLVAIVFVALLGLIACSPEGLSTIKLPEEVIPQPEPTPIPSPVPPRILSICLGKEPVSLFLYGDLSESANIIRQAIYDGPIDKVDFQYQPVVVEEIPSQENGLVSLNQIEIFPGQRMVDAQGNITILTEGVEFKPSGCIDPDCWEVYQNQPSIVLDSVTVRFSLKPGIRWSDGTALAPEDSLFSFRVAEMIYGSRGPAKLRFAANYQLLEDGVIQWTGLPGYQGIYEYAELFFTPLPAHLWASLAQEELLTSPLTNLYPMGWGPYRIQEWVKGDHITLVRNDFYDLASDGWPAFDYLVFRFIGDGQEALAAFQAGECAVVANTSDLVNYFPQMLALEEDEALNLMAIDQPAWEQISFGINSLDTSRRLLRDSRLRKALAYCLDRDAIAARRRDADLVVNNLFHPQDPRFDPDLDPIAFQPGEAISILESLGWVDDDQNPATARKAAGVDGIPWGTSLELSLLVPGVEGDSITAEMIQEQLATCGVEVEIEYLPPAEMLAPGPEGPVFGRQFDLALFSWTTGSFHLCQIFQSSEIPGVYPTYAKGWGGANAPGFSDSDFDQACLTAMTNLPDSDLVGDAARELQNIFAENLPILPLFFRQEVILSDPDLMGIQPGSILPLWEIEQIKLLD